MESVIIFLLLYLAAVRADICDNRQKTAFPHADDCDKYYYCRRGIQTEAKCPSGLKFDVETNACRDSSSAKCKEIKNPINMPICSIPSTTENPLPICNDTSKIQLLPDVEDCQSFYMCIWGDRVHRKCLNNWYFSISKLICLPKNKADCAIPMTTPSTGLTAPSSVEIIPSFSIKRATEEITSKTIFDRLTTEKTSILTHLPYCSQREIWMKSDYNDCKKYYQCFYGYLYHKRCPSDYLFSPTYLVCVPKSEAECEESLTNPQLPKCEPNETWLKPDSTEFSKYYQCDSGYVSHEQCPGDYLFSPVYLTCLPKELVNRQIKKFLSRSTQIPSDMNHILRSKAVFPTCDNGKQWLEPDFEDTTVFYTCLLGRVIRKVCPPGYEFNPTEKQCQEGTMIEWITSQRGSGVEECGDLEFWLKPDKEDCNKYFICHLGLYSHEQCQKDLYFSPAQMKCVDKSTAGCLLNTTEEFKNTNKITLTENVSTTPSDSTKNRGEKIIILSEYIANTERFSTDTPVPKISTEKSIAIPSEFATNYVRRIYAENNSTVPSNSNISTHGVLYQSPIFSINNKGLSIDPGESITNEGVSATPLDTSAKGASFVPLESTTSTENVTTSPLESTTTSELISNSASESRMNSHGVSIAPLKSSTPTESVSNTASVFSTCTNGFPITPLDFTTPTERVSNTAVESITSTKVVTISSLESKLESTSNTALEPITSTEVMSITPLKSTINTEGVSNTASENISIAPLEIITATEGITAEGDSFAPLESTAATGVYSIFTEGLSIAPLESTTSTEVIANTASKGVSITLLQSISTTERVSKTALESVTSTEALTIAVLESTTAKKGDSSTVTAGIPIAPLESTTITVSESITSAEDVAMAPLVSTVSTEGIYITELGSIYGSNGVSLTLLKSTSTTEGVSNIAAEGISITALESTTDKKCVSNTESDGVSIAPLESSITTEDVPNTEIESVTSTESVLITSVESTTASEGISNTFSEVVSLAQLESTTATKSVSNTETVGVLSTLPESISVTESVSTSEPVTTKKNISITLLVSTVATEGVSNTASEGISIAPLESVTALEDVFKTATEGVYKTVSESVTGTNGVSIAPLKSTAITEGVSNIASEGNSIFPLNSTITKESVSETASKSVTSEGVSIAPLEFTSATESISNRASKSITITQDISIIPLESTTVMERVNNTASEGVSNASLEAPSATKSVSNTALESITNAEGVLVASLESITPIKNTSNTATKGVSITPLQPSVKSISYTASEAVTSTVGASMTTLESITEGILVAPLQLSIYTESSSLPKPMTETKRQFNIKTERPKISISESYFDGSIPFLIGKLSTTKEELDFTTEVSRRLDEDKVEVRLSKLKTKLEEECDLFSIWAKSDITSCRSYYLCIYGELSHRQCPGDYEFSPTDLKCQPKYQSGCQIHVLTNIDKSLTTEQPKIKQTVRYAPDWNESKNSGIKCDDSVSIYQPDPIDCKKYYVCLNKTLYHQVCPKGLQFSESHLMCLPTRQAKCNSICKSEGIYFAENPTDSTKYFICFNKTPIPQKCPHKFEFDAKIMECTTTAECFQE